MWTFGDVTLARESAALLGTPVTFAPLRRLPQEAIQLSTALLVPANEPIDRLMTDLESTFEPKAAADLIRTQAFAQKSDDQFPIWCAESTVPPGPGAASIGPLLSLGVSIRAVVATAVTSDLASDGAAMSAHEARNRCRRQGRYLFPKRGQRIPLGGGDLVISHCETFLAEDFVSVPDRPFSRKAVVALSL